MAKRKTPKADKVIDLKPKAEKISEDQLQRLQNAIKQTNMLQQEIGAIELRKHEALHNVLSWQNVLRELQVEFKNDYGSDDINVMNGEIKYNENDNETNKKNNDREGL